MALQTKTITSAATGNGFTLVLALTENSTDPEGNTSSVSWELKLTSGAHSFAQYRIGWSVTLNGAVVSSQPRAGAPQRSVGKNSAVTIASGTAAVAHSDDGTLRMAASAAIDMAAEEHSPGPMRLAGSMALTDIPRASSLTAANGTLGVAQTLAIRRSSAALTHTLTYACGTDSGVIAAKTDAVSLRWTPPLGLAARNTAGDAVAVALTLTTYSGDTALGSVTETVTMTIPASVKPAVGSVSVAVVNDNATVRSWGVAVKGFSRLTVTTQFVGAQGSTAEEYWVEANGQHLAEPVATTDVLRTTDRAVKVWVKDSRNRWSDPVTVTGPVICDYAGPAITAAAAFRCDESGSPSEEGAYLSCRCGGSVSPCGGHNGMTLRVRYRPVGGGWSGYTALAADTVHVIGAGLSAQRTYEAELSVTDSLGLSRTLLVTIPTAAVTLNLRPGGDGAAFGKYAERGGAVDFGPWSPVGAVLGLGEARGRIQPGDDLNGYVTPGVYGIFQNADAGRIANCPAANAGTVRVWNALGDGQTGGAWHYVMQELVDYRGNVYLRGGNSGDTPGEYTWRGWWRVAWEPVQQTQQERREENNL